jgi:excinuclease UvrABC nuclease subunit
MGYQYRSVAKNNKNKFPQWMNILKNRSGVYIIKNRNTGEVLYIGESHTGRLDNTLKRHFYAWEDSPEREHFIFHTHDVEVAVILTPPKNAQKTQNILIKRLLPKHNTQAIPEEIQESRDFIPVVDIIQF